MDSAKGRPLVLHFPDGVPEGHVSKIGVYEDDGLSVCVKGKTCLTFVGRSNTVQSCRYALAVVHKRKRHVQLVPLMGDSMIRMEPRVEGLSYSSTQATTASVDRREGNLNTLSKFGDAARKKRSKIGENETAMELTAAVTSKLASVVEVSKAEGLTRSQVIERAAEERTLPPHDPEGTTLNTAFIFSGLCPDYHHSHLSPDRFIGAIDDLSQEMELRRTGECTFVMMRLDRLRGVDDEKKMKMAVQLAFLGALITFNSLSRRIRRIDGTGVRSFAVQHGLHASLFSFLLSTFFEERGHQKLIKYELPDKNKRLLQSYILVMALMVSDSELDAESLEVLRAEIKIPFKQIVERLHYLGAKITGRTNAQSVHVKLLKNGKCLRESLPKVIDTDLPSRKRGRHGP